VNFPQRSPRPFSPASKNTTDRGFARPRHHRLSRTICLPTRYSRGMSRLQGQRKASFMRTIVVNRIFNSPASTFCRFRVLIAAISASFCWVNPFAERSRRTLAPNAFNRVCSVLLRGTTHYIVLQSLEETSCCIVKRTLPNNSELVKTPNVIGTANTAESGQVKDPL
jgi:hypothetical protein